MLHKLQNTYLNNQPAYYNHVYTSAKTMVLPAKRHDANNTDSFSFHTHTHIYIYHLLIFTRKVNLGEWGTYHHVTSKTLG